jgi:hypothetical protein
MTDHPVKRKLERDVLPYLISARQPTLYTRALVSSDSTVDCTES